MRLSLYRAAVAALLATALAAGATAQPPSALDKLKADTAALASERAGIESSSAERAKLTSDLKRLLERLDQVPPRPAPPTVVPAPGNNKKETGPSLTTVPVDRLRAAMNLVLADQTAAALDVFRQIDVQQLPRDDRLFVTFMTASCLRRLGRTAEALPLYREVGNSTDDAFYSSSAVSQVALLNTAAELQAQLTKLRERPKTR